MSRSTGSSGYVYTLTDEGFQIVNGKRSFNRPLYGTHARDVDSIDDSVLVVAGDLPQVMSILLHAQQGAKGGFLSLGVISSEGSKWLHQCERMVTTYDPGWMRYVLKDPIFGEGEMRLYVVPLVDTEGFMVRIRSEAMDGPFRLVWTYGGLSAFGPRGSHLDYGCLEGGGLDLKDYAGNVFEVEDVLFRLSAPEKNPGKVFQGACGFEGDYRIADARMLLRDPEQLAASIGDAYPVGAHISQVHGASFEGYIVVQREVGCDPRTAELLVHPDQTFDECVKHYKGIARQVTVETPDRYLNKGMEALCLAMDAGWHHPTFMHGAWSWHEPYLGWRGWYGARSWGNTIGCARLFGLMLPPRSRSRKRFSRPGKDRTGIPPAWTAREGCPP
ncbi:MAG: DUF4450 domain-containing protein, partial [Candidatus Latescibacterota bacterium]